MLGPVEVDLDAREVVVDGTRVPTTRIEFELLAAIVEHPHQVRTREQLRRRAWGEDWLATNTPSTCTCRTCAASCRRRRAGRDRHRPGVGYRVNQDLR
ncbi:winged helix-turn-helix domain-containing protein [Saccharothrix sp. MB29]|nr:winged helix-turn-helix domain-containing protein [Saccharothrix sp. MB29]